MVMSELTVQVVPYPSSHCLTTHLRLGRPGSLPGGTTRLPEARSGATGE